MNLQNWQMKKLDVFQQLVNSFLFSCNSNIVLFNNSPQFRSFNNLNLSLSRILNHCVWQHVLLSWLCIESFFSTIKGFNIEGLEEFCWFMDAIDASVLFHLVLEVQIFSDFLVLNTNGIIERN